MAALIVRDQHLLLSSGRHVFFMQLRCPNEVQILEVPGGEFRVVNCSDTESLSRLQERQAPSAGESVTQGSASTDSSTSSSTGSSTSRPDSQVEAAPDGSGRQHRQDNKHRQSEGENLSLACELSQDGRYIALCDDHKNVHVYSTEGGRCRRHLSRHVARRCTAVRLTKDNQQVLVADRSGDVYAFDVPAGPDSGQSTGQSAAPQAQSEAGADQSCPPQSQGKSDTQAGEDGGEGALVLGHLSMLLDMLVLDTDRLVVTCDRDEKIRLSAYPDAYNIQAYCLGHTQFVISLAYDEVRKIILSGSGDCTVRLWNLNGEEVHRRDVLEDLRVHSQGKVDSNGERGADNCDGLGPVSSLEGQVQAIRQIVYCSTSQLLLVSLYRCPHVLVYTLTDRQEDEQPSLQLLCVVPGEHSVVSVWIRDRTMWLLTQAQTDSALQVSAFTILAQPPYSQQVPAVASQETGEVSPQSQVLHSLSSLSHSQLLAATPTSLDLFPLLWKSNLTDNFGDKSEPGDEEGNRTAKRQKL